VSRNEIVSSVRPAIHAREANLFQVRDGDIYAKLQNLTGEWRVWVFPVFRRIPAADDTEAEIDVPDGGRELAFSSSGVLLSYKRVDVSPHWLRPEYR
jgi:hypothetical protein